MGKIADLTQKAQAGGRFGQIFQNMINEYSQCNVNWEQPTAPLVDISDFERANDNYSGAEERSRLPLRLNRSNLTNLFLVLVSYLYCGNVCCENKLSLTQNKRLFKKKKKKKKKKKS